MDTEGPSRCRLANAQRNCIKQKTPDSHLLQRRHGTRHRLLRLPQQRRRRRRHRKLQPRLQQQLHKNEGQGMFGWNLCLGA